MRPVICDLCGTQSDEYFESEWSELNQCVIGCPEFENICGACTLWLIKMLEQHKNDLVSRK